MIGSVCIRENEAEATWVSGPSHTVVSSRRRPMNAACPTTSFFGNHLTCPFRIMFIVSIPGTVRHAEPNARNP